jgi:hypothetical protein
MSDAKDDFTPKAYAALIEALGTRGYSAVPFAEARADGPDLILRHDIDMSVAAAAAMADLETGLGVTASYFVLLRSDIYNPFAPENADALKRIAEQGHEIGLHFDASLYDSDALEKAAETECGLLEVLIERPVATISFHRPAKALQGCAGFFAGRRHAYEPLFFTEMGYCSDSRGGWHHGHPLDHDAVAEGRGLQLLTHPIWWTGERYDGPVPRLDDFRRDRDDALAEALAANCEPYRARAKNGPET